jgi:hypothetical protein
MNINEIEIGSIWKDNLGKAKYSKIGELVKGRLERLVTITNKTSNTIEYKDGGGYISWISFEDFLRVENSLKAVRFTIV